MKESMPLEGAITNEASRIMQKLWIPDERLVTDEERKEIEARLKEIEEHFPDIHKHCVKYTRGMMEFRIERFEYRSRSSIYPKEFRDKEAENLMKYQEALREFDVYFGRK